MSFEREHSLNRFLSACPSCAAVTSHAACWVEFTSQTFKGDAAQFPVFFIFFLPVWEKTCQFWALQEPHESLTTHIKQRDRHRGRVGCSINSPAAVRMDRLHCFLESHLCTRSVWSFQACREVISYLKSPSSMRKCGVNMICFLWYLRDDWCNILSQRRSVVFYVIHTGFDESMKYIKCISNRGSRLSSPVKPVLCESVGYGPSSSLLCINST